ncbi:hypothetical protein GS399_02965 [Pedobacter sp. HMF7647]|uniref:Hint domain-containing protein n=1 Tax=Hufsiella arboris TaxID=2695275 RepID=A0A7K1Y786_9SPHI|nr:Hint domain-containing protein [Hufsiella arboris]MXV49918.1 hypothetical protein [Hufsiella arboris]
MTFNIKRFLLATTFILIVIKGHAQDAKTPRPLTMDEYKKAKTFTIKDLDNETYVKFENTYVLDRYQAKKPYFITGDDGLKKRIDLYKLIAKEGMQELGLMIFYTDEKGKVYQALLPNASADPKVWEAYFEDIHGIDKMEKNFVLKLSYVLSKEVASLEYSVLNGGKEMKDEHATYGNDICFPGSQEVTMLNGSKKLLKDLKPGDEVLTLNESTKKQEAIKVKSLIVHEAKNYAITSLTLVDAVESANDQGIVVKLSGKLLKATPNHPMKTSEGLKKAGEIKSGDKVYCFDELTKSYELYTVLNKTEAGEGSQKVYNIEAEEGNTLLLNGVMVMQK